MTYQALQTFLGGREPRLKGIVRPRRVRPVSDIREAVARSLREPIGAEPLREVLRRASTALVLTVDATRPSPKALLEPIFNICDEEHVQAAICIAIGRHRQMREEELAAHLGKEICRRYRVIQHDPFDDEAHVDLGETRRGTPIRVNRIVFEADAVLGVGIIEPSYLCGFSGGRKLIMPGIAHHRAIDANHYHLLEPGAKIGVLDGNPVSEDALEVARKVPFHWITYAVVGPDDAVVNVVSGDPYEAHRWGCERSREIYAVQAPKADIIIASPGGPPYDCDLVQTKKAIVPAREMVTPGGAILIVGACPEGWGAEKTFSEWMTGMSPQEVAEKVRDRSLFGLGAHGAYLLARPIVEKGVRVIFVTSRKMAKALSESFVDATDSPEEALSWAERHVGKQSTIAAVECGRRLIVSAEWDAQADLSHFRERSALTGNRF